MTENKQTLSYIKKCILELNNDFNVTITYEPFIYFVSVSLDEKKQTIKFPRSLIDDFEVALEQHIGTSYFGILEYSIKFTIYLELGKVGLLPNFEISHVIVGEKRDWIKKYPINVFFDKELTKILHEGLQSLARFFEKLINDHRDLPLTEVHEHKDWVESLLEYYEKNGTLDSQEVGLQNLQYLKAAALSQILESEKRRRSATTSLIKRGLNEKIYFIVAELRKDPFLEIPFPDFVQDLIAEQLR